MTRISKIAKYNVCSINYRHVLINYAETLLHMSYDEKRRIKKLMKGMCIYMALIDLGIKDFEKIRKKIYDYYGCTISACYNNPEYLKHVLVELYGNKSGEIILSIKNYLDQEKESDDDFIRVLNQSH